MAFKKEPCRNFQRGSCHYGERCKFLHTTQHQAKQNSFGFGSQNGPSFQNSQQKPNPFGFGSQNGSSFQNKQQKPNPFGFGVQNNSQPKPEFDMGSKQNQSKAFENKWTRSSTSTGNSPSLRQPENLTKAVDHDCTDVNSCKRVVLEDFRQERPLWILTCYGHRKSGPCDISGDVSYEELRAAAYNDAKSGMSLQAVVDRERSLLNSKLTEFENFLHKSSISSNSTPAISNPNLGTFLPPAESSFPPHSSFSQLGAPANAWTAAPQNNAFGQSNAFPNFVQSAGGSQQMQTAGNAFSSNLGNVNNRFMVSENNTFPPSVGSQQISMSVSNLSPTIPGMSGVSADYKAQAANNFPPLNDSKLGKQNNFMDSIWMKEEWVIGEIPEEAPPDEFIR